MTDRDIVEFISARLDDDERIARGATSGGPWRVHGMAVRGLQSDGADVMVIRHTWPQEAEHIVRHDPARVLREVAAKRSVVGRYEAMVAGAAAAEGTLLAGASRVRLGAYLLVLQDLTAVWSDHPDYDQAWAVR